MKNSIRRPLLPALAAILAVIIFVTGSHAASAQCCPTYQVVIGCTFPTPCFPLMVRTTWTNGLGRTGSYFGCGTFTETAPSAPGCWGGITNLATITINGVNIPAFAPCSAKVNIGCACLNVCISTASSGCPIIITITRLTC